MIAPRSFLFSMLLATGTLFAAPEAPDVMLGGFAVGEIKLMCRERHGWDVEFRRETDKDGIEYAVVEMKRDEPEFPAPFNLSFNFPKRDTVGAWRPWSSWTRFSMYWNPSVLPGAGDSDFRKWLPLYACYGSGNRNRVTFAASESSEPLVVKSGIKEEDNRIYMAFHFYNGKIARRKHLVARLRIDSRDIFWSDAVKEAADWMSEISGRKPANVPDAAFAPLYSTWYNFHQNVFQDELERECEIASKMGMKTIIVDDGWPTDDTNRGYAFCGDWKVSKRRFPDMKAHVAKVHAMGMKYMMWYSVPFVGKKSANWRRFKGKCLNVDSRLGAGVLDPRFPDVREFLISTYEKAVREWDIDGLKLDFIDRFAGKTIPEGKSMGGRDIRSVPEATEKLIADIYKRLSAIKKDILIEFRQTYIGPSIRAGANMLRVSDCPADMQMNRCGIVNLRLTSGGTAVHADPLEWHPTDTAEAAAKNVLSSIFGTIQYSMKLAGLDKRHSDMIAHWSRFGAEHEAALQRGRFRAYHPELSYPLIEGESGVERIFGVYAEEICVSTGALDKPVYILNSTDANSLAVEIPSAAKVVAYDTYGACVGEQEYQAGCHRMAVPLSGYLKISSK